MIDRSAVMFSWGAVRLMAGLLALLWAAPSTATAASATANVALHARYRLKPAPNYSLALDQAATELTNGVVAGSGFWRGASAGWQWTSPIVLRMELDDTVPIGKIRLHSGRNQTVGIDYVSQALVFLGDRQNRFEFVGDVAGADRANVPGPEETRFFELDFAPRKARTLLVVLYRSGGLLFLDEVEVWSAANGQPVAGRLAEGEVLAEARRLRRDYALHRSLVTPIGEAPSRRWAFPVASQESAASGRPTCTVERIDPWADYGIAELPRLRILGDQPLTIAPGGHGVAAWRIVNQAREPAPIKVETAVAKGPKVALFALSFAQSLNFKWVGDVVMPFQPTSLPAGSGMIIIAEVTAAMPGPFDVNLVVGCGTRSAPQKLHAVALAGTAPPLHGTLWGYLYPAVTKALSCDAAFPQHIGMDTAVVPPQALRSAPDQASDRLLHDYFRAYRSVPRLLLFMDLRSKGPGTWQGGDLDFAKALPAWWPHVLMVAREEHVEGELIFYPFDEIRTSEIPVLAKFRQAATAVAPNVRLYATLDDANTAAAADYLDIVQALDRANLAAALRLRKPRELHLYDTKGNGKELPVQSYYRLQGWRAFQEGYQGVGFWSLWDSSGASDPASGWSDFGDIERDFGALYAAPGACAFASRRLLAWRQGQEDYRVLSSCAARISRAELSREVGRVLQGAGTAGSLDATLAGISERCR